MLIVGYRVLAVILAIALLAGCSGAPVATDYDPEFDFSTVRSYAWLEPARQREASSESVNDLMSGRIRSALADQMRAQGIREAASGDEADILLTFHMRVEDKIEVHNFHDHFGYYPCFSRHCHQGHAFYPGGIHHDHWVAEYQSGRLVIDMVSPQTRRLLWRGVSERRIPWLETPEERRLFIVDTVGSIMQRFPPGRGED